MYFAVLRNPEHYESLAARLVSEGRVDDGMRQFGRALAVARGNPKRAEMMSVMAERILETSAPVDEAAERWFATVELQYGAMDKHRGHHSDLPLRDWFRLAKQTQHPRVWSLCKRIAELRANESDPDTPDSLIALVATVELANATGTVSGSTWEEQAAHLEERLQERDDDALRGLHALCLWRHAKGTAELNPSDIREIEENAMSTAQSLLASETADSYAQTIALRIIANQQTREAWEYALQSEAVREWLDVAEQRADDPPENTVGFAASLGFFVRYFSPPPDRIGEETVPLLARVRTIAETLTERLDGSPAAHNAAAEAAWFLGDVKSVKAHSEPVAERGECPVSAEAVVASGAAASARIRLARIELHALENAPDSEKEERLEKASETVNEAVANLNRNSNARRHLEAELALLQNRPLAVLAELAEDRPRRPTLLNPLHYCVARAFMQTAHLGAAAEMLAQIRRNGGLGLAPFEFDRAEEALVEVRLLLKRPEQAAKIAEQWEVYGNPEGWKTRPKRWLLIERIRVNRTPDPAESLAAAERLEALVPSLPDSIRDDTVLLCCMAYDRAGRLQYATEFLEQYVRHEKAPKTTLRVTLIRRRIRDGETEAAHELAGALPSFLPEGRVKRELEDKTPEQRCSPAVLLLLQSSALAPTESEFGWFAYLARESRWDEFGENLQRRAERADWTPSAAFAIYQELDHEKIPEAFRRFDRVLRPTGELTWLCDLALARYETLEGDPEEALRLTASLAESHPYLAEVWSARGEAAMKLNQYEAARNDLARAVVAKPYSQDLHVDLFRTEHALGSHTNALYWLREALRWGPNETLRNRFLDYATEHGNAEKVLQVRQQMATDDPSDLNNQIALAELLQENGQIKEADTVIKRCYELAEEPPLRLVLLAARHDENLGDKTAALQRVVEFCERRIREQDPADSMDLMPAFAFLRQRGAAEQAAKLLRAQIDRTAEEDRPPWLRILAHLRLDAGQPKEAMKTLADEDGNPVHPSLAPVLVRCLVATNKLDRAREVLAQANADESYAVDMVFAEAELAAAQGDWARAQRAASALLSRNPDSLRARAIRIEAALRDGASDNEFFVDEDADAIEDARPNHPVLVRIKLLRALKASDVEQTEEAARQLAELLPADPFPHLMLGRLYAQKGEMKPLRARLPEWRERFPDEPEFLLLEAAARAAAGDVEGQGNALREAMENATPPVADRYARFLLQQEKLDQAEALFEDLPFEVEGQASLLIQRARVHRAKDRPAAAAEDLISAFELLTETPTALFSSYFQCEQWFGQEELGNLLDKHAIKERMGSIRALFVVGARVWRKAPLEAEAIRRAEKYVDTLPEDHPLLDAGKATLVQAWLQTGYPKRAYEFSHKLVAKGVKEPGLLNNHAYACAVLERDLERAVDCAKEAIARATARQQKANFYDTLALVQAKSGLHLAAGESYAESIRLHDNPTVRVNYAELLADREDFFEAERQLARAEETAKENGDQALLQRVAELRRQHPKLSTGE